MMKELENFTDPLHLLGFIKITLLGTVFYMSNKP